jgi:hypothetical protein
MNEALDRVTRALATKQMRRVLEVAGISGDDIQDAFLEKYAALAIDAVAGWIPWGMTPLPDYNCVVEYKLSGGGIFRNPSNDPDWPRMADPGEIVAFRIAEAGQREM